ncbi:hypothetical protein GH714_043980 [Hevea brasiliensis]|uniref:Uncharacterized protein n=1 Tax=Hevea brasiliensis TaxID=3981 RepID=A0A6A6K2C8_HEVBR|nr:hypothetical protein GH714_043980 [Hevea brasiliensis]
MGRISSSLCVAGGCPEGAAKATETGESIVVISTSLSPSTTMHYAPRSKAGFHPGRADSPTAYSRTSVPSLVKLVIPSKIQVGDSLASSSRGSLFETVEEAFARQSTYGIGTANAASLDDEESRKEEFIFPGTSPLLLVRPIRPLMVMPNQSTLTIKAIQSARKAFKHTLTARLPLSIWFLAQES